MSTDRELLELAAKAAGMDFLGWEWSIYGGFCRGEYDDYESWNPLTDDGDALRLAVKLRICVMFGANTDVVRCDFTIPDRLMTPGYTHGADEDPYATTRRAIVRAAAEIGRTTPAAPPAGSQSG